MLEHLGAVSCRARISSASTEITPVARNPTKATDATSSPSKAIEYQFSSRSCTSCTRAPGPNQKRRLKLVLCATGAKDIQLLESIYRPVLAWLDDDCRYVRYSLFQTNNTEPDFPLPSPEVLEIPHLAVTLLLQETEILGSNRLNIAHSHFQKAPWKLHHGEPVEAHKIHAYPYNSHDYFTPGEGLPLCSVRQVHAGEEFLRVTQFVTHSNWTDVMNMYKLILNQDPDHQKGDFCLFTIGMCKAGHSVQFALKKLPKSVRVRPSRKSVLVFRISDVGSLVPLLPHSCHKISNSVWQTSDLDGNCFHLEELPSGRPRSRHARSRRAVASSGGSKPVRQSSFACVILETAQEFLQDSDSASQASIRSTESRCSTSSMQKTMEEILSELEKQVLLSDAEKTSKSKKRIDMELPSDECTQESRSPLRGDAVQNRKCEMVAPLDTSGIDTRTNSSDVTVTSNDCRNCTPTVARRHKSASHRHTDSGFIEERSDGDTTSGSGTECLGAQPGSKASTLSGLAISHGNNKVQKRLEFGNEPQSSRKPPGSPTYSKGQRTDCPWARGSMTRQSCVPAPPYLTTGLEDTVGRIPTSGQGFRDKGSSDYYDSHDEDLLEVQSPPQPSKLPTNTTTPAPLSDVSSDHQKSLSFFPKTPTIFEGHELSTDVGYCEEMPIDCPPESSAQHRDVTDSAPNPSLVDPVVGNRKGKVEKNNTSVPTVDTPTRGQRNVTIYHKDPKLKRREAFSCSSSTGLEGSNPAGQKQNEELGQPTPGRNSYPMEGNQLLYVNSEFIENGHGAESKPFSERNVSPNAGFWI